MVQFSNQNWVCNCLMTTACFTHDVGRTVTRSHETEALNMQNECVGIRWVSQREFNRETTNTLQGQPTGVVSSQQEGQADVLEWILYYYNTVCMYFRNLSFYMKSFILFWETSWSVIFRIRLQSLAELTPLLHQSRNQLCFSASLKFPLCFT